MNIETDELLATGIDWRMRAGNDNLGHRLELAKYAQIFRCVVETVDSELEEYSNPSKFFYRLEIKSATEANIKLETLP